MRVSPEWLSIRRKLPLLISALLCAVVAALSWASYRRLEGALVVAAGDRVMNVAQRLAGMLDESARRLRRDLRQVSGDSAVVKFVAGPSARRAAVEQILNRKKAAAPQIAWLEIRRANGTRLLTVGETHAPTPLGQPDQAAASDTASRAAWIGPLFAIGDTVYFNIVSAIVRAPSDTL